MIPVVPEVLIRFGSGAIFEDSFVLGTDQGVLGVNVLGSQPTVQVPSVQQIGIRRGRASVDQEFGAGTCRIRFQDFTGEWNPTDPNGPYFGELTPGRQLQIRAIDSTNTGRNLFAGYITSWDWSWELGQDHATVFIDAADAARNLELADITTVTGAADGDLPGVRIGQILDELNWPATARNITTGTTQLQVDPGGDRGVLEALRTVEQSDLGALFVDASGRVTYLSRNDLSTRAAGTPVVFNETERQYVTLDVALEDTQIVNAVTITPLGGTPQTATNPASITKYFRRFRSDEELLMQNDARALQQATAIVAARGEPNLELRAIQFDVLTESRMVEVITTEIGDPLEVTRTYTGSDPIQFRSIVQGIEWDIVPNRWRGTFSTADTVALTTAFVLGSTQFGVLGVNTLG
jgi:hypothetical protein